MSRLHERLRNLLYPKTIVYVGGRAVEPAIAYSRKLGFNGTQYVINPHRKVIAGIRCVHSAHELPETPDAAFVLVPSEATVAAVRDLADARVGAAVVGSSGFAEFGRQDLQDLVMSAAGDMPVLGPNSPGFANFLDGVSIMLDNMGMLACKAGVAVISNGGAYMTDMACCDRSLPLAMMVGVGNQGAVSIADMANVVLDDERVTAVNLYIESLNDVARLSEVAEKSCSRGVPVVVLKSGRTRGGIRAARTHTAAMASDAAMASALFRRFRFIEVRTGTEAIETLKMLSIAKRPNGRRVGFATSSGSYAAMGADLTEEVGLTISSLTPERQDCLQNLMEPFVTPNNPIDLATAQFWPDRDQRRLFEAFLERDFDIAVQCMSFPAENTWEDESWYRSSRIFAEAASAAGLSAAFVSSIPEGLPKKAREMLIGLGVAPLQGLEDGLRAIAHSVQWAEDGLQCGSGIRLQETLSLTGPTQQIDEAKTKEWLQNAGVPTPNGFVWETADPPVEIVWPVALKLCDAEVSHKSDIDGVELGISSMKELRAARHRIERSAWQHGIRAHRFLVEPMVGAGMGELLVGLRHVDKIGQVLTVGAGGIWTEILQDTATLILPATRKEMEMALRRLRLFPVLNGWRGRSKADCDAAIDAILAICTCAELYRATLCELEINPLIVLAEGQGVCAVDAMMTVTGQIP